MRPPARELRAPGPQARHLHDELPPGVHGRDGPDGARPRSVRDGTRARRQRLRLRAGPAARRARVRALPARRYFVLAGALSRLGDEAVVPAACDAVTGVCANPCEGNLGLVSKYNQGESTPPLLPVLWHWDAASTAAAAGVAGNEWIGKAPTMHGAQYDNLLRMLWWSYVLTGPMYQCARVLANSSPRETRNYLFRRLLQDYHPRAQGQSRRKRLAIIALVWVRYRLLLLRAMSMEARLLYVLAYWPARGAARLYAYCAGDDKPPAFAQLVVLRESQSARRGRLAKYAAAAWYFFSLAFYALLPACALCLTIGSELGVRGWVPQSADLHDVSQWIAWALVGGAAAGYAVWYMLFEYLPKLGLRTRRWEPIGERERIYITDPSSEAEEPDKIALMEKNMEYNDLGWRKYILARIMVEWYDFRYWWRDPVQASAAGAGAAEGRAKKSDDPWDWDETYRRGGGAGEIDNWTAFPAELASRPVPSSPGRHHIQAAPAPRPIVEYSYDDEAETQRLLREQDGRRRKRG
ncbi:uncharacterized protein E0L32_000916 [Thyridium curvatum]|uniref:Uncharacterized protein n=1 Tax=Thyridium curvatum TaxID=1093900 RepID=A0A507B5V4_9PEZI|nr:uncharacterized protein E0L32_000916 [Thyridium curvatum]TPX12739.1 hypothetical protein E0L32_000916 [Thyridium curvatum]